MLQTSSTAKSSKNLLLSINMAKNNEVGGSDSSDCEDKMVERSPCSKNSNRATGYLTPDTGQTFTQLRQASIKAPILQHFDLKCHIRIETDASGYGIGGVLSQLTDSGQ